MFGPRTWCALALVLAASFGINAYYVYAAPRSWDETINVKAALHDTSDSTEGSGYVYSIDHPALKRHVYRAVLRLHGITAVAMPDVDYSQTVQWNIDNGRFPQFGVVVPLRFTNAVLVTGAVALVFFAALSILRAPYLAALVVLPLVASDRIGVGVVGYVGCDAFLAFFMALSLLLIVVLAQKGRASGLPGLLLLGLVGGLAASSKLNGALVVIAVMAYLALSNRGADRIMRPLLAGAVSVGVFVVLNPVMRGGGLGWAHDVIQDMLDRRAYIWVSQHRGAPLSRTQLVARFFPYAAYVYAGLAAGVLLRRRKWLVPLAVWGATLILGTLFSVNMTYERYFLPVEMGAYAVGGIFAWALVIQFARGDRAAGAVGFLARVWGPAVVSTAAVLVLITFMAAWLPWGPSRLRPGFSAAGKAAVFWRQTGAFYGVAEPLTPGERVSRAGRADWQPPTDRVELPKPLLTPLLRRRIATAVLIAGLVLVYAVGRRVLGSGWLGAALLVPFLWVDLSRGDFWMHGVSDSFLVFFTALSLHVWVRFAEGGESADWRRVILLAVCTGAAAAAAPAGAALVVAVAVFAFMRAGGLMRLARPAVIVVGAGVALAVMEPLLWYLGGFDTLRFAQGMFGGAFSHWTAKFAETTNILIPFRDYFPYWPLLPLGAVALWMVRREKWAAPLVLYGIFTVAAALVGLEVSANRVGVEVNLALSVCAGLPALRLLSSQVTVAVSLEEPPA